MDNQQLKYFVAVFRTGSHSQAARMFSVSRQAVNNSIQLLERELGAPLFAYENGSLHPTATGRAIYKNAVQMIRLLDNAPRFIGVGSSADIIFGVDSLLIGRDTAIASMANDYARQEGGCNVIISQVAFDEMYNDIISQRIDFCLARTTRRDFPKCELRDLRVGHLAILASVYSEVAHMDRIYPSEMSQIPFIAHKSETSRYFKSSLTPYWERGEMTVASYLDSPILFADILKNKNVIAFGVCWNGPTKEYRDDICAIPISGIESDAIADVFLYAKDSPKRQQIERFIDYLMENDRWKAIRFSN